MANYRSDGIGCGGIIIVGLLTLLLTIWNYDLNPFSNEIRAHYKEEICKEMKIGKPKCKWVNSGILIYKISFEEQLVISSNSNKPWPFRKINNCVISDKRNWNCDYENFRFGFKEGDFIHIDDKGLIANEKFKYISKLEWFLFGGSMHIIKPD